jgi:hypothetical protein
MVYAAGSIPNGMDAASSGAEKTIILRIFQLLCKQEENVILLVHIAQKQILYAFNLGITINRREISNFPT